MSHHDYIKIYTGEFITVQRIAEALATLADRQRQVLQRIAEALEKENISPIIKDRTGSGLTPLFGASNPSVQEIHVHLDELDVAVKIVESFTSELEND